MLMAMKFRENSWIARSRQSEAGYDMAFVPIELRACQALRRRFKHGAKALLDPEANVRRPGFPFTEDFAGRPA
jgi:hypothetical protein